MSTDLQVGSQLADYQIEALVGRGGMGVVYRARDPRLDRTVALKVLPSEFARDEDFRTRFERESRLAALIDHPNIIPVYEAGEADGRLFIAMRWVEGSDLRGVLEREGSLGLEAALAIIEQVGGALDAAHEEGLLHRDVKPANVLIARRAGPGGRPHAYLSDFGIAKLMAAGGFTRTGLFLGTPDYAAPEQFEGKELDGRADVYALGCLLYNCLTGAQPFGTVEGVAAMYAHLHTPPPRLTDARPDLPGTLDGILARAMAKSRDERFPNCAALVAAARAAVGAPGRPTVEQKGSPGPTVAVTPPVDPTVAATPPPAPVTPPPVTPPPIPPAPASSAPPTTPAPAPLATARPPAPPPPAPGSQEPEPRKKWAFFAIGVAIAAAAIAATVALVLTGGGDEETAQTPPAAATTAAQTPTTGATTEAPPAETSPAETPPAETPPATGAPASVLELGWAEVSAEALQADGRQEIYRVAAGEGDGATAVGSEGIAGERDAVFWELGDSVERVVLAQGGEQVVFGVAAPSEGAVAVGFTQADPPAGEADAAVWRFVDGGWEAVDGLTVGGYEKMNRVAAGSGGELVAVGAAGPGIAPGGTPLATDGAAWVSLDAGATWARSGEAEFAGVPAYQELRGVVAYGGGFVSVGQDGKGAGVWRSDGDAWRQVSVADMAVGGGSVELDARDVAVFGDGLVAIGDVVTEAGGRDGAVWASLDGEQWSLVGDGVFGGDGDQQIYGVAAGEFGVVAVGCSGCGTDAAAPVVWASVDGDTWKRFEGDGLPQAGGAQELNSVTVIGSRLVAAGWARAGGEQDATFWTAALPASAG